MLDSRNDPLLLFAPAASAEFGSQVAAILDIPLTAHEEREYDGGEHKMRPLDIVRGRSVYVLQCLRGDARGSANDRLCRLLFFIGALKDAGAKQVTACLSYLAYARKDRRTKPRDPVTTRYVAQLFETMGTDRVVALEVHNLAAFENAFRCQTIHLEATDLFVAHFLGVIKDQECTVASPDIGGVKRARHFQELLQQALGRAVGFAFMDKKRSSGVLSGETLVGDVAGRRVILLDDLVSSGNTMLRAVDACRRAGAAKVDIAATHAVFSPAAVQLFEAEGPDSIVVTDSVPLSDQFAPYLNRSLQILTVAPRFAQAIRRLELGSPVSELGGL